MQKPLSETIKTLLIINVLLFFASTYFIPNLSDPLFSLWHVNNPNFKLWQILTHMFMHGNLSHLIFNMFSLYMFAPIIEERLGTSYFLFLYFSAGFAAAALTLGIDYYSFQEIFNAYLKTGLTSTEIYEFIQESLQRGSFDTQIAPNIPTNDTINMLRNYGGTMVGASGAISGVLVAFAVLYPNLPLMLLFIPFPIKAKYFIGAYFLLDVYGGLTGNSIIGPENTCLLYTSDAADD